MPDFKSFAAQQGSSYLFAGNAEYLEELYEQYLADPNSVAPAWQSYFQSLSPLPTDNMHAYVKEHITEWGKLARATRPQAAAGNDLAQARVWEFIDGYRRDGHIISKLDPLGLTQITSFPTLNPDFYGLTPQDMGRVFDTDKFPTPAGTTLQQLQSLLQQTYCGALGFEYMYISDPEQVEWLRQRIETIQGHPTLDIDAKRRVLNRLTAAEGLEKYLATRYVGQKRFGLEGGEALIPMLDELIQRISLAGGTEIVFGMAHRGRLNVLVNILGRPPSDLFLEFEGKKPHDDRSGDVKYHLGFSSNIQASGGIVHLTLGFNPSHLEIICPVAEGSVRARQDYWHDGQRDHIIPVLIHGDAAFIGQGVNMETFNFSRARGFNTGGTLHIVVNNQIGFTTSNPQDSRSTRYCTDIAKMIEAPVIHVNGDDPDAVVYAIQLAVDFRMTFNRDIVVDLVCYRRHGHNEADEPAATQPLMYQKIRSHPSVLTQYAQQLVNEHIVSEQDVADLANQYRDALDQGQVVLQTIEPSNIEKPNKIDWTPFLNTDWTAPCNTQLSMEVLTTLAHNITTLPQGFTLQPQVRKVMDDRVKMTDGELPLNWGFAESLAFASLLNEGYSVRLCGQDSARGTFAHRHGILNDYSTGATYIPLQHVSEQQAPIYIYDSTLSENAVMAFEYGYASTLPNTLVLWEAQYGDFANGAQVVIDQFISSGDQKWGRLCGLVLLLPHGYEGSGPEHSSARLERYLQLCAQNNMQVVVPTTPAQIYHLLRRQMLRPFRKPLVVMSPKNILRHKLATSTLEDLAKGEFQLIIPEIDALSVSKITRVVLCSGKVYYDLLEKRRSEQLNHIAILRIEQLYPFPVDELTTLLAQYAKAKTVVWCQEEPKNQGAWYCTQHNLLACLSKGQTLVYAGREASASPATGYMSLHLEQQAQLVKEALAI